MTKSTLRPVGEKLLRERLTEPRRSAPAPDAGLLENAQRVARMDSTHVALENAHARSGLIGSRAHIAAALALACVEHDARPGVPCWGGDDRSPVQGFCASRWARVFAPHSERIVGGTGVAR